ncbi:NusG domain II-containing protein [Chitinispirillales bacterium ANBcel5]|uniref:NusG domain II-containing protein n=1 Tax=Cellulosispirillum alkaliphilum TaxID=3039283 RepID=UPI002A54F849|nr:NusG domain II-containing protein [Chitinispirillales bacterium ANBcel5]
MKTPEMKIGLFRTGDLIILLLLLAGMVIVWPLIRSSHPGEVVIFRDNQPIATYPLRSENVISIRGELGQVGIMISDGKVQIHSVTCPHQICKRSGAIQRSFQQLVCVPNRILVEIRTSEDSGGIDAITY